MVRGALPDCDRGRDRDRPPAGRRQVNLVGEDVQVKLTAVAATFKPFDWVYHKTSFPKAKDDGQASVSISDVAVSAVGRGGAGAARGVLQD
eukprot:SAG25_NODE_1348_length_3237_cov_4.509892_3_plen_91_part_00